MFPMGQEIVNRLNNEFVRILKLPEMKERLLGPGGRPGRQFRAGIRGVHQERA